MIINDSRKFCFIHIPKCAGTSVRELIQPFDDLKGAHHSRVEMHENLGLLDYVHIPIKVLEEYFPEYYQKVKEYYSIVIVRDPYKRFASSVTQRLKMYHKKAIKDLTKREIECEVNNCINYLKQNTNSLVLDASYIHFQPQITYINNSMGECIVNKCYLLENVEDCELDLAKTFDLPIKSNFEKTETVHANKSVVYRSSFIKFLYSVSKPLGTFFVKPFISQKNLKKIRDFIYVPRDRKLASVFNAPEIITFIEDYYKADISLYTSLCKDK